MFAFPPTSCGIRRTCGRKENQGVEKVGLMASTTKKGAGEGFVHSWQQSQSETVLELTAVGVAEEGQQERMCACVCWGGMW